LKIVLCIQGLINLVGGAEKGLCDMANEFQSRGYSITIINYQDVESTVPFYYLNPDIEVINISEKSSLTFSKPSPGERILNRMKLMFRRNDPVNWSKSEKQKIAIWKKAIIASDPDVVISFMPFSYICIAPALKETRIPLIIRNASNPFKHDFMYFNQDPEKNIKIHVAAGISGANVVYSEKFISYFSPEVQIKTHVIPNIVEFVKPIDIARPDNQSGKNVIVSLGRIIRLKNHILLVKAFEILSKIYPDWNLYIYGSNNNDDYYNTLINYVVEKQLNERIFINPPEKNISTVLSISHIFAFPSVYEGWGRALTEAMAYALPSVVLSDCFPPADLINASNGGFVAENNPGDFASKLEELIVNPVTRRELGLNARAYVQQFNTTAIFDKWEELIKNTVQPRTTI
jgi:GalNAc-alpha-(1->4)-GalNAc-alpha-(1->3)-diNAcBac-PP-undecaprenol alpha-1,4-N-acetyl-D-galactosaminyltransferase